MCVCLAPRPALAATRGVPYRDRVSTHVTLWKKNQIPPFLTASKLNSVELLKLRLLVNIEPMGIDGFCAVFGCFCVVSLTLSCGAGCGLQSVVLVWAFAV